MTHIIINISFDRSYICYKLTRIRDFIFETKSIRSNETLAKLKIHRSTSISRERTRQINLRLRYDNEEQVRSCRKQIQTLEVFRQGRIALGYLHENWSREEEWRIQTISSPLYPRGGPYNRLAFSLVSSWPRPLSYLFLSPITCLPLPGPNEIVRPHIRH